MTSALAVLYARYANTQKSITAKANEMLLMLKLIRAKLVNVHRGQGGYMCVALLQNCRMAV